MLVSYIPSFSLTAMERLSPQILNVSLSVVMSSSFLSVYTGVISAVNGASMPVISFTNGYSVTVSSMISPSAFL